MFLMREIINYKSLDVDSYYFSNNTNIYPIKMKSDDEVSSTEVETSYFNRIQVLNLLCNVSTFYG